VSQHEVHPAIVTVCEAASDPMMILGQEALDVRYANPPMLALVGLHSDAIAGSAATSLGDGPFPTAGGPWRVRAANGRHYPTTVSVNRLDDLGLLLATLDATLEDELQQRLDVIFSSNLQGLWDWDLRNDDLVWSDRMLEMVGLDRKRFRPKASTFFDRLHPKDRYRIEAAIQTHLDTDEPYDVDCLLRHQDGHFIHVRTVGQSLRDADGNPVRLIGAVEDLSEQLATREALTETEERFRQLAKNVPGAIFRYMILANGNDAIEYMSPGCLDIWELDASTIEGDPSALWAMVKEEDLPAMQQSVMTSAETMLPWDSQWRITTPSGKKKWLHGRGTPTRLEDGSTMWNSLILDISSLKAAEAALQESRELFYRAQKTESLGQLTGGLAHDFNNLLAVILGNLELLGNTPALGPKQAFVDDALRAAKRGRELTHGLLAFARRASLAPEPVDIASAVEDLNALLKRTLPATVQFVSTIDRNLPPLLVDRAALESALLNLVLNSRDAIDNSGGISLSVALTTLPADNPHNLDSGDYVSMCVKDNGPGMPEEMLDRVLEPFFTTKEEGKGSGLGLSIVEGFVRQSGGAISIESAPNIGTSVTLLFPVQQTHEEIPHPSSEPPMATREANLRDKTILIVEDEDDVRRMLSNHLQADGFTVLEAPNGSDGKTLFDANLARIDLVMTDFVMPGAVQGSDLAGYVRKSAPHTPVVLVSGYINMDEPSDQPDDAIADARLDKPVGREELLSTVRRLISEAESVQTASND